jgi:hypothetical protein
MLGDRKIYQAEDRTKGNDIREEFGQADEILTYWKDNFWKCQNMSVRRGVKRIFSELAANGNQLQASHIVALKAYRDAEAKANDILEDGENWCG